MLPSPCLCTPGGSLVRLSVPPPRLGGGFRPGLVSRAGVAVRIPDVPADTSYHVHAEIVRVESDLRGLDVSAVHLHDLDPRRRRVLETRKHESRPATVLRLNGTPGLAYTRRAFIVLSKTATDTIREPRAVADVRAAGGRPQVHPQP